MNFEIEGFEIEELEKAPKGSPMEWDMFHMGTRLGANFFVLRANFEDQVQDYIILVNPLTGARIKIKTKEE
jgi:hypothetical protein